MIVSRVRRRWAALLVAGGCLLQSGACSDLVTRAFIDGFFLGLDPLLNEFAEQISPTP